MADYAMPIPPQRAKIEPGSPLCHTCVALTVCTEARAEIPEKKKVPVCISSFLADRGCLS